MNSYQNNDRNGYQDGYNSGWGQKEYYQNNQQGYYQNHQQYHYDPRKNYYQHEAEEPMTLGEWMLTLLITIIPCVNIIMMFVWAFGSGAKRSKSNWAKAALIFILIAIVIGVVLVALGVVDTEYYIYYLHYNLLWVGKPTVSTVWTIVRIL